MAYALNTYTLNIDTSGYLKVTNRQDHSVQQSVNLNSQEAKVWSSGSSDFDILGQGEGSHGGMACSTDLSGNTVTLNTSGVVVNTGTPRSSINLATDGPIYIKLSNTATNKIEFWED